MKVKLAFAATVAADELSAVVVAAWVTDTAAVDDVLAVHCGDPPYFRLKLCAPTVSGWPAVFTLKLTLTGAFPFRVVVARLFIPSNRVTVPVGAGPSAPTFRVPVTVIGVPRATVAGPVNPTAIESPPCVTTVITPLVVDAL